VSDLALDPVTGDLLLVAGRAKLVTGAAAVAQSWASHLTMGRGEWFLDRSSGIDFQNDILDKFRPTVARAVFTQASRDTPGVADVRNLRFALDRRTRLLRVAAEVVLDTGSIQTLSLSETIGG
jgi:hypothetical protein